MKRQEVLAALKSRVRPLEDSVDGELRGGFAELSEAIQRSGDNNGVCPDNGVCYNNSTCSNNVSCNGNNYCVNKPTKSTGEDVMNYSTIF